MGLLALTGLTVSLAGIELGRWIIITALTIASIKTVLVLNIFMHLKFEERTFRVFVAVALVTLAIFVSLTFFDYAFR
jgi:cytochrome c oxidase subunit 4